MVVVLLGTLLTVVASYATGVSLPDMVGILCGATTNTPALGAAQQTLKQMGMDSSTPALGCAVPSDARYIWLPVQFKEGIPYVEWMDNWTLDFFQ